MNGVLISGEVEGRRTSKTRRSSAIKPEKKSKTDIKLAQEAIAVTAYEIFCLFVPVTACIIFVAAILGTVPTYTDRRGRTSRILSEKVFGQRTDAEIEVRDVFLRSLAFALILVGVVVILTFVVIVLFILKCYMVLRAFFMVASCVILFFFGFQNLMIVLAHHNIPTDYVTVAVMLWNYGITGLIVIHFSGPILLQQIYLVLTSAFIALNLIMLLPDWSVWLLLAIISVWDLIAVLCPMGPLRILIETAQKRDEPLFPSLVYSTQMAWIFGVDGAKTDQTGSDGVNESDQAQAVEAGDSKNQESESSTVVKQSSNTKPSHSSRPSPSSRTSGDSKPSPSSRKSRDSKSSHGSKRSLGSRKSRGSRSSRGSRTSRGSRRSRGSTPSQPKRGRMSQGNSRTPNGEAKASKLKKGFFQPDANEESPAEVLQNLTSRKDAGVKLGLGDFIFYSILVGKAALTGDGNTTIACYIGILVGLSGTLILLFVTQMALPALPLSVSIGMFFFFGSSLLAYDFGEMLQMDQIYI